MPQSSLTILGHTSAAYIAAQNLERTLRNNGWSGGGLGKGGQGISEPIIAEEFSTQRQGLGSAQADKDFKVKMNDLVQEYATSTNPYDLVFASGFTNEERAAIHQ